MTLTSHCGPRGMRELGGGGGVTSHGKDDRARSQGRVDGLQGQGGVRDPVVGGEDGGEGNPHA